MLDACLTSPLRLPDSPSQANGCQMAAGTKSATRATAKADGSNGRLTCDDAGGPVRVRLMGDGSASPDPLHPLGH
jgi:hypothetical protein